MDRAGDPAGPLAGIQFKDLGTEHLVFDFRFESDRFFEQIQLLGREVLPKIR